MKGFRKLVILGTLLVTLLVIIDTIDAGKKEPKKKEIGSNSVNEKENTKNVKNEKLKKSGSFKPEKVKKSKKNSNSEEYAKQFSEEARVGSKKYKGKKFSKYATKDSTSAEEEVNPQIIKTHQKVKKYQIVEDEPAQKFTSGNIKGKKTKSVKKTYQTKTQQEKDNYEQVIDDLNRMYNEENVIGEEENEPNSQKKKKYKLVEVVIEDDGEEDKEGNETSLNAGSEYDEFTENQRTENENVFDKYKQTQSVKPKTKRMLKKYVAVNEEDINEYSTSEDNAEENSEPMFSDDPSSDTYSSRYEDPGAYPSCEPIAENPNRVGPKKLTFYVYEDEVNGRIKKRLVPVQDGVTMCEVADLLKEQYYGEGND